ncbi:MAG: PEP-CTERM sorting domain-containing protein [Phycisphaerae bacterium]|nr:PEP-CTERM sorting domain-containing protein [Phycisphaerae bacterium]
MKRSTRGTRILLAVLSLVIVSGMAAAAIEPTPLSGPNMRPLRTDYVRTWYIYNDDKPDGILDPGDHCINMMDNWWSGVSSGTQHTSMRNDADPYAIHPGDRVNTSPMNHASTGNPSDNLWLPRANRSLNFYMSYSQTDNNSAGNFKNYGDNIENFEGYGSFMAERHGDADGWHLGWVINDYDNSKELGPSLGNFDMDIFVHNGRTLPGQATWISNPHVSGSNRMDDLCMDSAGNRVTVKWNQNTMAYDDAANQAYINFYQNSVDPNFNVGNDDIVTIGDSMEVHERNPYASGPNQYAGYIDTKDPQWVLDNMDYFDPDAGISGEYKDYKYDDAFTQRSELLQYQSLGGVIAGLSGYDNYDPEANNWWDQQVVRIDLGQEALAQLDTVIFYDFGYDTAQGASQTKDPPVAIIFDVFFNAITGEYELYYNGERMKDNRIYIARVDIAPEPMTMALLSMGGLGLLGLRRRRKHQTR